MARSSSDGSGLGGIAVWVRRKIGLAKVNSTTSFFFFFFFFFFGGGLGTYSVEYYAYHQTAARAARNVFAVAHVRDGDLKAVAAGTWVVVYLEGLVVEAVLDLDLVVEIQLFVGHVGRWSPAQSRQALPPSTAAKRRRRQLSPPTPSTTTATTMTDVEPATVKLAELLRHPEDLDKIPALKAEFTRKKAAVDGQLRHGLREQLEVTQAGMNNISDGQRTVNLIKEEMMKIDKLCAEAQNMIQDFPHINLVAQTHKNFEQVEAMKRDIDTFAARVDNLEYLLGQDDEDPANQPNLLELHFGLTQLREVRDSAIRQIKASEGSMEMIDNLQLEGDVTVQDLFARLDDVIEWFDKHIGEACINLIELVQSGNDGMVVRLALVIEEEEKSDTKAQALQDAQREYKDLAARFKSIATGSTELRGYKDKFLKSIDFVCKANFDDTNEQFLEDPEKLNKHFKWYFNNLNTVKLGMQTLMPKKWKIYKTYADIYHKHMHDWMLGHANDEDLGAPYLLNLINWVDKYYANMKKLGFTEESLQPHVVDNRVPELVRNYRQLIIDRVEEWMDRIATTEKKMFGERDQEALAPNADGYYQTKTLGDMWTMLGQNLSVAANSNREDVAEGVVESMFRALTSRQRMWQSLVETEASMYGTATSTTDGADEFQLWLISIANDQIICIDESDENQVSFLGNFERDIAPLVSQTYGPSMATQIETLRNNYVDLATTCIHLWCQVIFYCDFREVLKSLFTAEWYSERHMEQMVRTFDDYIADYRGFTHHSIFDILIDQLADELLVHYLSSVRNKGAKIKRADPFIDKIRDDCQTAFGFFNQFPPGAEIKERWRVIQMFLNLLSEDKANIARVYENFKYTYPDLQIGWVEAVLRCRDDFERSMLNEVKAKAGQIVMEPEQQFETIMGRVK
ncbi:exocyst complex component Sec6 [Massarina eburnea CBS 473.64]|uniref:Exocyst complex component Sec6 n=1 Tax=Massarina eburnea CBS 473.64 TaxID=1395130 RepID=A0A6A6RIR3_9PLEO|nr:exocyst complex component Sec6 [Massarina eburnea CBS 473.64]